MSLVFDQNSKSRKKTINPVIENLLKEPISFQLAKYPDKVSIKPSSYTVFKGYKKGKTPDASAAASPEPNTRPEPERMTRPKSLAEALANYAGQKPAEDADSGQPASKKKKASTPKADQKQRLKKLLLQQSKGSDAITSEEDETDEKVRSTDEPELAEIKNEEEDDDEDNGDEDEDGQEEDDDDDEDDDEDFHTAESEEDNDEEDDDDNDGEDESVSDEEDNDDGESNNNDNEEIDEESLRGSSDVIDPLKKDLKEDTLTSKVLDNQPVDTPPTSNNDDDEYNDKAQLINTEYPNQDFWDLSESPNDHGTNDPKRIDKSWGDFIEGHTSLGLLNHGVTCYMNAAVQSMCHIPSLTHYLIDVYKGKYDDKIAPDSVTKVLASTVAKMYRIGHNKKIIYINPKKLCKRLNDINCMMSEWQQEDSHEYYMSLMSRLQEDSTPKGVKLNKSIIYDIFGGLLDQTVTCKNCGHISTTQQEFYDLSLGLDSRKKRTSLMVDPQQLYQLRDQIEKCDSSSKEAKIQLSKILQQRILLAQEESNDSKSPEQEEENSSSNGKNTQEQNESRDKDQTPGQKQDQISADKPNSHPQSQSSQQEQPSSMAQNASRKYLLENSIRDFFTPEIIKTDKRDQSGYVCEKCNIKTNAIKISTIQRSPETLSIHLKRFRFNGQQSQKVKANVKYPEILDLTSFTTDMSTPTRYKLTSVIIHQGRSVSSGHYIAHCRQPDGTWATYDDEYINKIPRASALSDPGAYVLIYERLTYKTANGEVDEDKLVNNLTTRKRKRVESGSSSPLYPKAHAKSRRKK